MGKRVLIFLTLLVPALAQAQISITVNPTELNGSGPATSPDIGVHCMVTNNSLVTLNLLWSRSVLDAPEEWTSWICDMNNCYLPYVDQCPDSRPNILEQGQSMELQFHVGPDSTSGQAEYMVYLFDQSDPDVVLDSVHVSIETTLTGVTDLTPADLRIYPNPTTQYFQISNSDEVGSVVVYSIVGNRVREYDPRVSSRFYVADLPQGIYLVRMLDNKGDVLKTARLSKR